MIEQSTALSELDPLLSCIDTEERYKELRTVEWSFLPLHNLQWLMNFNEAVEGERERELLPFAGLEREPRNILLNLIFIQPHVYNEDHL